MNRFTRLLQCGLLAAMVWAPAAMGQEPSAREKWKRLSPEEQSRILGDYHEWQQLPPAVREKLAAKYREFSALPPETRLRLRKLWERIQALPAAKRERLLGLTREKWGSLTPQERSRILNDLRQPSVKDNVRPASERERETRGSKR
jgi:predicted Fe-S protein YdhL (DUF1289 family)